MRQAFTAAKNKNCYPTAVVALYCSIRGQQPITAAQRDNSGDKALAFFCSKINKGFAYIKIRVKLESYY